MDTSTHKTNNVSTKDGVTGVSRELRDNILNRLFGIYSFDSMYKSLISENASLTHNKTKLEEQIYLLVGKLESMECQNKQLQLKLETYEGFQPELHDDIDKVMGINNTHTSQQILILEHELGELNDRNQKLQETVHDYQQKYTQSVERVEQLELEVTHYTNLLTESDDNVHHLKRLLEYNDGNLGVQSSKLVDVQNKLASAQNDIMELDATIMKFKHQQQKDEQVLAHKTFENQQIQQEITELQEQLRLSEDAVNVHHTNLTNYKCTHHFTDTQYADLKVTCNELQNLYDDVIAQKNITTRKLTSTSKMNEKLYNEVDYLIEQHTRYCHSLHKDVLFDRC